MLKNNHMTPSKLINKAVEKLKKECGILEYSKGHWIVSGKIVVNKYAIDFLTKCIQESYEEGKKEEFKRIYREIDKIVARNIDDVGHFCSDKIVMEMVNFFELQSLTNQSKEDKK